MYSHAAACLASTTSCRSTGHFRQAALRHLRRSRTWGTGRLRARRSDNGPLDSSCWIVPSAAEVSMVIEYLPETHTEQVVVLVCPVGPNSVAASPLRTIWSSSVKIPRRPTGSLNATWVARDVRPLLLFNSQEPGCPWPAMSRSTRDPIFRPIPPSPCCSRTFAAATSSGSVAGGWSGFRPAFVKASLL